MTTYKNHTIAKTNTTTDVQRAAFGHLYDTVAHVYEIEGEFGKNACTRPFLTSVSACQEYINNRIND